MHIIIMQTSSLAINGRWSPQEILRISASCNAVLCLYI